MRLYAWIVCGHSAGSDIAGAMQSTSHVPLACMFIDTVHDNTCVWYTTSHSLSLSLSQSSSLQKMEG